MRKRSKASLKKALWKVFTEYVKNRDGWRCVTCGKRAEGQGMNGGHYIAKAACGLDYYFSEFNTHAQCVTCNLTLEGNRPAYRRFILERYGPDVLRDLETNYHRPSVGFDFEAKIAEYKGKLAALQANNGKQS